MSDIEARTLSGYPLAVHEFVFSLLGDFTVEVAVKEGTLKIRLIKDATIEMKYNGKGDMEFKVPIGCLNLNVTGTAMFTAKFIEGQYRFMMPLPHTNVSGISEISHFESLTGIEYLPIKLVLD